MNKNCQQCNKEFEKPETCSVKDWASRKFCSKECYSQKAFIVCWECKNHFQVRRYRKDSAHFCSTVCSAQYRDQGKRTADKKIRQSARYKAWRTLVFERDNYTCQSCTQHGGYLHADHIQPFALFPELRFEVSNGRTLCVPCHKKTGTYGRGAVYRNRIASA